MKTTVFWLALALAVSGCGEATSGDGGAGGTAGSGGSAGSGGGSGGMGGEAGSGGSAGSTGSGGAGGTAGTGGTAGAGGSGGMAPLANPSIYASGGDLYDACGSAFVPIGVNHRGFIGTPEDLDGSSFAEIAKTGANAIKFAWGTPENVEHPDFALQELDVQIQAAIDAGLIPIIAMYDAIGPDHWDDGAFEHLIQWYESAPVVAWMNGTDANGHNRSEYLILNLAVEAGPGVGSPYTSYTNVYADAITRLRDCTVPGTDPCYTMPFMITADNWGRDPDSLVAAAPAWLIADPLDNIILSWHPYDPLSAAALGSAMDDLQTTGLPVVIAEFSDQGPGPDVTYPTPCLGAPLLYNSITAEANARGIGWIPWAWGSDPQGEYWSSNCWENNMTSADACSSVERWGCEVAFTNPNSIANTAVRPQYITDRCGTETIRAAPAACGHTCPPEPPF